MISSKHFKEGEKPVASSISGGFVKNNNTPHPSSGEGEYFTFKGSASVEYEDEI